MAAPKFAAWEAAAGRCHGQARPGARALMAVIITLFVGLKNWGIYNCRNTALGNPSAHGDGRALDVGCDLPAGRKLVRWLLKIGPSRLGIGVMIHEGVIYSAKSPNGRRYTGHPHHDHVHLELTRTAAERMTVAAIRRIIASVAPPAASPKPRAVKLGSRVLKVGSKGRDVRRVQRELGVRADGHFGDVTAQAVKAWQSKHGLKADGVIGKATWLKLIKEMAA